jgi:hypothetical protein
MAEPLEDYLRRLLQQAQQAPPAVKRMPPPPVLEAELIEVEPEPAPPARAGDSQFGAPQSSLGAAAPLGAERLETHVHEAFDRSLGAFDPSTADPTAAPIAKSLADELTDLLRTPDGVRKAFVLTEVLQRPEHRW